MPIHPRLALLAIAAAASQLPAQAGWSPPQAATALNSTAADSGPHLSFDGLTLHFSSFRSGNWEIYQSTRSAPGAAWSVPALVTELSDSSVEDQPFLAFGDLELYFGSMRAGGAGGLDILRCTRPAQNLPWSPPTFVTELNSSGSDSAFSMTLDGLEAFFLTTGFGSPSGNNNAIFRAVRTSTSQPFGTPSLVTELWNPNTHRDCEIAWDGLSIVYTEFIGSRLKVLHATRPTRNDPFGPPVVWSEFDSVGTATGVFSFTRSYTGNDAYLAAGFSAAAGGQEIMSTKFNGLTQAGRAGLGSFMNLHLRDSARPGHWYSIGAALGNTGFVIGSRTVPLDPDWLLFATLGVDVAGYTAGWGGTLDANGEAFASLTCSAAWLLGFDLHVGALVWDVSGPFGVGLVANSIPVKFH
ncbi:MAG: hypothetical protein JNK49_15505 [Planctomycetes bacterium]|nr:hypothetical protein [Planctomycetota bacterium]